MRTFSFALLVVALVAGCDIERLQPPATVLPPPPTAPVALAIPDESEVPPGPEGAAIRRGRAILRFTRDSLPDYVGATMSCTNCHLEDGTRPWSSPWVGVYGRFPQYRTRNDRMNVLGDRINDCMQRSMNGRPLPFDGSAMRDMIAYMAFLSRRIPNGARMEGQGFGPVPVLEPDTARGQELFRAQCTRCHGKDGSGTDDGPPLWGPGSFTIGAGMARLRTAAAFIRHNMPEHRPGSLTDQQAYDVAGYVLTRPRPDFEGKEFDWPNGNHPPDVPYVTRAAKLKADSARRGT
jgi:thiosulfate dehydrogenase